MVFFKALKIPHKKKIQKKGHFSIFELKKLNIQTSELYKTIYFLKVHLKLSFNHMNWVLINYDIINFLNLKNRTISKILEICQIQEASFQCATKKKTEYYLPLNVYILTLERKITQLDSGLLLSQTDSTENWNVKGTENCSKIFTVRTRKSYLLVHNFEQFG